MKSIHLYIDVLRFLQTNGEIDSVGGDSDLNVNLIKGLYEQGLIDAIDVTSLDGPAFLKVRINFAGQARLKQELSQTSAAHHKRDDDILDVKPNVMGIGLNLNAVWRRFFGKK